MLSVAARSSAAAAPVFRQLLVPETKQRRHSRGGNMESDLPRKAEVKNEVVKIRAVRSLLPAIVR